MNIRGFVTGIFRDVETGKVTKTFTEENHISRWMLEQTATVNLGGTLFGRTIYVTDYPYETTNTGHIRRGSGDIALGFTEGGVSNPVGGGGTDPDPYYLQFQQRFNPPASDRTIAYIGLTSDTSIAGYHINPSHCGVQLTSVCTQTTTETLDVFYRVQFAYEFNLRTGFIPGSDTVGISRDQAYLLYRKHLDNWTQQWPTEDSEIRWNGNINVRRIIESRGQDSGGDTGLTFTSIDSGTYAQHQLTNTATISSVLGSIIGFFGYGQSAGWMRYNSLAVTVDADPIQNLFAHGPAADKPFFDSTNLPAGDATLAFGGSSWTNPSFPKLYRVNVTTGGTIGNAEYQLWERNAFGFDNNTWANKLRTQTGCMSSQDHMYDDFRMIKDDTTFSSLGPRFIRYGDDLVRFLAIRQTELCLANAQTDDGIRFNETNYPTFQPTDITDVAVDSSGRIYVADRSGGSDTGALYIINDPTGSPSITKIDNTTTGLTGMLSPDVLCVGIGRNDKIWIAMDGGLFYSDDTGATWTQATFAYTDITDNWYRVKNISCDTEHANDRIGIVYLNSRFYTCWYELSTTTASAGPDIVGGYASTNLNGYFYWESGTEYTYINMLAVSPTESKWGNASRRDSSGNNGGYPALFDFGTTTINQHSSQVCYSWSINEFITDTSGNQALFCPRVYTGGNVTYGVWDDTFTFTEDQVATSAFWQSDSGQKGSFLLLPGGVLIGQSDYWRVFIASVAEQSTNGGIFENMIWTKYGWNGAAWELGHAGSKVTHGTEDAAVDGLTIQFDDNAGAENYVADDFYTVGVLKGIWLDGSTEIVHNSYVMYTPTWVDTDTEVSIIPNTQRISKYRVSDGNTLTWQNLTSGMTSSTDALYQSSVDNGPAYDRGGRSVNTTGGAAPTLPSVSTTPVIVSRYGFQVHSYTPYDGTNAAQMVTGLSDTSVIGTAIDYSSPQFALHFNGKYDTASYWTELTVVESGITKYTFPDPIFMQYYADQGSYDCTFTVNIMSDGSVEYWMEYLKMYTSPPGTANPALSFIIDQASTGDATNGVINVYLERLDTNAPTYVFELGSAGSPTSGYYRDAYDVINTPQSKFYIDGVEAEVFLNDRSTVLTAGQVAVYQDYGEIRISPDDIGKTLTAEYLTQTNY